MQRAPKSSQANSECVKSLQSASRCMHVCMCICVYDLYFIAFCSPGSLTVDFVILHMCVCVFVCWCARACFHFDKLMYFAVCVCLYACPAEICINLGLTCDFPSLTNRTQLIQMNERINIEIKLTTKKNCKLICRAIKTYIHTAIKTCTYIIHMCIYRFVAT